jgi:hypothetical protein
MIEPIHTKLNTLQQRMTDDIIALNARIDNITTTPLHVANTVRQKLEPSLRKYATNVSAKLSTSLETATNKLTSLVKDLNSSLGHVTKILIPQLDTKVLELASSFNARFKALASPSNLAALKCGPPTPNHVDNADSSNGMDDADGSHGSAPARTQVQPPPAAPPPANVLGDANSNAEPHVHNRNAINAPP